LSDKYNIRIFEDIHNSDLERHWKRIEEETDCFPQMYYEWCEPWWRLRSGQRKLHIVSVENTDHKIVGIAPLCIEKRFSLRILRSFPVRSVDFYNFLIEENEYYSKVIEILIDYMQTFVDWHIIHLFNINSQSMLWEELKTKGLTIRKVTDILVSDFQGMSFEKYMSTLSSNTRSKYGKFLRRLGKKGKVNLECIEDASSYTLYAHEMRQLYEARWSDDYYLPPDDKYYQFRNEAVTACYEKGKIVLFVLKLDDRIIAFILGFMHKNVFFALKISHDPSFNYYSPGILILGKIIEHLISRNYYQLNYMAGDYPFKRSWVPEGASSANYEVFFSGCSIRARLYIKYRLEWRDKLRQLYYKMLDIRLLRATRRWIQVKLRKKKA